MSNTPRPSIGDLVDMWRGMRRGSPADEPMSILSALRSLLHGPTAADSPMSMKDALRSPVYRDLSTPKLRAGDEAFTFELSLLDMSDGIERRTGRKVRLAEYRGVRPVALIFGSYT